MLDTEQNRTMFQVLLKSRTTRKPLVILKFTNEFAIKVFGCNLQAITAERAKAVLTPLLESETAYIKVIDLTK